MEHIYEGQWVDKDKDEGEGEWDEVGRLCGFWVGDDRRSSRSDVR